MKLPAYTAKSRHGVYYYRLQYFDGTKRKEQRFSLGTKSPRVSKLKSLLISAIIAKRKNWISPMVPACPTWIKTPPALVDEEEARPKP